MGLPLTGKTTLGKALSKHVASHYIDIDDGPVSCAPPQEEKPLRSDEARARERKRMTVAYTILHAAVRANLTAGWPIIVSATYSRHSNQEFLCQAVKDGGGELKLVWCRFDDTKEEIARRVNERIKKGIIGGCRSAQHYLDDKTRYEGTNLPHLKIDPSSDPEAAISRILEYINE